MVQETTKSDLDHVIDIISTTRKNGMPKKIIIEGDEVRLKPSYDGAINLLLWNVQALARRTGFSGTYEQLITYAISHNNSNNDGNELNPPPLIMAGG